MSELADHYALSDIDTYDSDSGHEVALVPGVNRNDKRETSKFTKLKVLLSIGAVAASPYIVTKIAEGLGNQEKAPWHHVPTHVQKP